MHNMTKTEGFTLLFMVACFAAALAFSWFEPFTHTTTMANPFCPSVESPEMCK